MMYADPEASLTRNKSMKREPENVSIWKRRMPGSSATRDCSWDGAVPHARRARRARAESLAADAGAGRERSRIEVRASPGSPLILLASLGKPGSAPVFFICAGCRRRRIATLAEGLDVGSGRQRRRHVRRLQFVDAIDRLVSNVLEDVGEIRVAIEAVQACGADQAIHRGGTFATRRAHSPGRCYSLGGVSGATRATSLHAQMS